MKTLAITVSMLVITSALQAQSDSSSTVVQQKLNNVVEKMKEVKQEQCAKFKKEDEKPIQTIMGKSKTRGAYFGINFNHSFINNQDALGTQLRLGWINNHVLGMGFYCSGFSSSPYLNNKLPDQSIDLSAGHIGFFIEPYIFPRFPVHVSFPVNIGVGGVALVSSYRFEEYEYDYTVSEHSVFSIIEPGVELEANLFKHMRMAVNLTYRKTYAMQMSSVERDVLDGFTYGFTLKFGKF